MPHSKQSYTIQFKNEVLDWMHEAPSRSWLDAASHFQIQPKTIRNWLEQEKDLRSAAKDGERLRLKKQTRARDDYRRYYAEDAPQSAYLPYNMPQKDAAPVQTTEALLMKLLQLL